MGIVDGDGCQTISELADNLRRVFKKMHLELESGNDEHSNMIDLINHADTLAQQIESQIALDQLAKQAQEFDMGY